MKETDSSLSRNGSGVKSPKKRSEEKLPAAKNTSAEHLVKENTEKENKDISAVVRTPPQGLQQASKHLFHIAMAT